MSLYIELINRITTDSFYRGIILLFAPLVIIIPIGLIVIRYCYNDKIRDFILLVLFGVYVYWVANSFAPFYSNI